MDVECRVVSVRRP